LIGGRRRKPHSGDQNGGMELDDDESEVGDVDEDMLAEGGNGETLESGDNEEEVKAKIEKMQLAGVSDVRSVAGLMKTLEPVLEVSELPSPLPCPGLLQGSRFTSSTFES
jgi:U4/U6 small nuclear ribonucleoprotein PRP31